MGFILNGPCFKPEPELYDVLHEETTSIRTACDQNRPTLGAKLSLPYETRSKLCVFDLTVMICKKSEEAACARDAHDEWFARHSRRLRRSPKKITAMMTTSTTLSLSIGAT